MILFCLNSDRLLIRINRFVLSVMTPLFSGRPRSYIDPHTYEDPALLIGEFAIEIDTSLIMIEAIIGGGMISISSTLVIRAPFAIVINSSVPFAIVINSVN